ncbi:C39 family peptidase [Desulfosarcina sp.]|uniref:C39 family peptidase n=1 Tax=Desulfosarcina sp. TaxID=2027861 RepID=UPI0035661CE9
MPFRFDKSTWSSSGIGFTAVFRHVSVLGLTGLLLVGLVLMAGCAGLHSLVKPSEQKADSSTENTNKRALNAAVQRWMDKLKRNQSRSTPAEKDTPEKKQASGQAAGALPGQKSPESTATGHQRNDRLGEPGQRGSVTTIRLPNGMYVTKKVVSLREARYTHVIPQRYDLSCGAAALATILNYFFDHRVDEADIIKHILARGDANEIQKKGFSLLDLKKFAVDHGYLADGYKVDLKKLSTLKIPVIILFKSGSYSHFVVLKGIDDGKAYIADPAYGNRSMPLKTFEENWNEVIFIVATKNMQNRTPLPMETTLSAPVLAAMRMKDLFSAGFAGFTSGEF